MTSERFRNDNTGPMLIRPERRSALDVVKYLFDWVGETESRFSLERLNWSVKRQHAQTVDQMRDASYEETEKSHLHKFKLCVIVSRASNAILGAPGA